MASISRKVIDYPTSDGRPMAETDFHRNLMAALIDTLTDHYQGAPMTYVSGNLMLFYEEGNKRKHISPDVFVVHGVAKKPRLYYMRWEEAKSPDVVLEITSKTTRSEDVKKKLGLYRDVLKVPEYFLFDPFQEYLKPSMQGYRLLGGEYQQIEAVAGRLPSEVLGLHLERSGLELRLWEPLRGSWLLKPREQAEVERLKAESERLRAEAERLRAESATQREEAERLRAESATQREESERLRAEAERLRAESATQREESERLRAESATQRAEAERQQAEAATQRADRAEAELDRLRRELESLRQREPGSA